MKKSLLLLFITLSFIPAAYAQDADDADLASAEEPSAVNDVPEIGSNEADELLMAEESPVEVPGGPKTMSGMSILGNEETPKSLVIVPWKSSEMGDELNLSDTLDERATPVDKEVFLREVNFYQIRSSEQ